jgi:hypothetical protein
VNLGLTLHSLTPEYLDRLRFDADQAATLRAIGEYRGKQALFYRQAPEMLKGLRETAVIESSESSNRLEGVIVPAQRLNVRGGANTCDFGRFKNRDRGRSAA